MFDEGIGAPSSLLSTQGHKREELDDISSVTDLVEGMMSQ